MAKLDGEAARLLAEKRSQIAAVRKAASDKFARIRKLKRLESAQQRRAARKLDARVKILWGATLLDWMANDPEIALYAKAHAVRYLKRPRDLELLGIVL